MLLAIASPWYWGYFSPYRIFPQRLSKIHKVQQIHTFSFNEPDWHKYWSIASQFHGDRNHSLELTTTIGRAIPIPSESSETP
jgi:hypothetical protein